MCDRNSFCRRKVKYKFERIYVKKSGLLRKSSSVVNSLGLRLTLALVSEISKVSQNISRERAWIAREY